MDKKILRVYLAKNDTPYSTAYAKLDLPASPWEVWDAMEKVRLQRTIFCTWRSKTTLPLRILRPIWTG